MSDWGSDAFDVKSDARAKLKLNEKQTSPRVTTADSFAHKSDDARSHARSVPQSSALTPTSPMKDSGQGEFSSSSTSHFASGPVDADVAVELKAGHAEAMAGVGTLMKYVDELIVALRERHVRSGLKECDCETCAMLKALRGEEQLIRENLETITLMVSTQLTGIAHGRKPQPTGFSRSSVSS